MKVKVVLILATMLVFVACGNKKMMHSSLNMEGISMSSNTAVSVR